MVFQLTDKILKHLSKDKVPKSMVMDKGLLDHKLLVLPLRLEEALAPPTLALSKAPS